MQLVPPGLYVMGSLDPATTGAAAFIVGALDKRTGRRWIYDAVNVKHPTPHDLKERVKALTIEYGISEWRIEKTGLLTMFTQDFELNQWLLARGSRLVPHYTGKNKHDTAFGVGAMAPLFGTYQQMEDGEQKVLTEPLIELPRHEGDVKTLVDQLMLWHADVDPKKTAIDMVMALWFFSVGCAERMKAGDPQFRRRQFSKMTSPRDRARAGVVNLSDFRVA
jgi:hypothetical protein